MPDDFLTRVAGPGSPPSAGGSVGAGPALPPTMPAPIPEAPLSGAGVVPPGVATPPEGQLRVPLAADLPVIGNPEDVIDGFYRQNGRNPTEAEILAIRAVPLLSQQLRRRPTKQELLAFLDRRRETPPDVGPPAFEQEA